jgi:MFS family permease
MGDRNAGDDRNRAFRGTGARLEPGAVAASSGRPVVVARRRAALTAVTLAMFCMEASFLALMLALPDIARLFGRSPEVTQDAVSAYLLSLGATLLVAGRIGDIAGSRRVFVVGCLLFVVALVGAGLAPALPVLVIFRLLQGVGAGLVLPAGIALVTAGYAGPDRQARALGLSFALASVGTVIGPLFGGLVAAGPGWRWIFWILVPFAMLAIAMAWRYVPDYRAGSARRKLDIPGAAAGFLAVAAAGTGIDRADSAGWSGVNVALVAAGLGFAALFFLRARRAAQPLIDLSVFRSPRFGLVLFMSLVSSGCYVAAVFVVSAYLQDVRDLSAIEASAVLAVMAALVAVAAPVGARLRPHVGPILVMAGGV